MLQLERPGQDNKDSLKDAGSKTVCVFSVTYQVYRTGDQSCGSFDARCRVGWPPAFPECVDVCVWENLNSVVWWGAERMKGGVCLGNRRGNMVCPQVCVCLSGVIGSSCGLESLVR